MYNIIKIELFWSLEVTFSHFYFLFILGFIAHIKITVNLRKFFNYLFRVLFQHIKYILRRDFRDSAGKNAGRGIVVIILSIFPILQSQKKKKKPNSAQFRPIEKLGKMRGSPAPRKNSGPNSTAQT
jgi:hypothetical protein